MIVTFDDSKNMYSETLRVFKDRKSIPKCRHCGSTLSYDKSISFIMCRGTLDSGQECYSRHGSDYKEVFEFNEEEVKELQEFSAYCQTLKPFTKQHSHYRLNATLPIKCAKSIKYDRGLKAKVDSISAYCEKSNDGFQHLAKEVIVKMENPSYSPKEIKAFMYTITNDNIYLSDTSREIFIF